MAWGDDDPIAGAGGGWGDDDPVAPRKATAKAKPKRTLSENFTGAMANLYRGTGVLDEVQGGMRAVENTLSGRSKIDPRNILGSVGGAFKQGMAEQRQVEDRFNAEHPVIANQLRGTGMAATALVPTGASANLLAQSSRGVNAARGATTAGLTGAGYAAADRGTGAERLKLAGETARNPLVLGLGATGGAIAPAARRAVAPRTSTTDAAVLKDIGVSTTIPQRMGRGAKQIEDLLKRFPIVGQAISGANTRQVEQLNRGVALKALEPVGLSIPRTVKPGFEMVEYVDDALGGVYTRAAKMVPKASADQVFIDDLAGIAERKADLPENVANQFDSIVQQRLARLNRPDATGALVKQIHGELGALQAEAARKGESTLSGMLADTRRAVMGIIERANPQAGALIRKADKGWQVYSIMNDAAASASNRGGVFLPGQLNTQVRGAGRSMGSNMTGKGKAPLQDISTAATRLLPDSFGNPGTANAALLSGGGVGAVTAPVQTAMVATGLAAAGTPYFLMARKVIEELPPQASAGELQEAAQILAGLAARDPAVNALRREVAARLSRAGGVAGASASAPQPATPTSQNVLATSTR